jgi:hypothetical protein
MAEKLTETVINSGVRCFLRKDFAGLRVIAGSAAALTKEIANSYGDEPDDFYQRLGQNIINSVFNHLCGECLLSDDENPHPIDVDSAEKIKDIFSEYCSASKIYNLSTNPFITLHSVYFSKSTALKDQLCCLMTGNLPHKLAEGFLNIDTGNHEALFNPFANAILSHNQLRFEQAFSAIEFDQKRLNHYRNNAPAHFAVESAMHHLHYGIYDIDEQDADKYNDYIDDIAKLLEEKPEPHQHLSVEVVNLIAEVNSSNSLESLSELIESKEIINHIRTQHLDMRFNHLTTNSALSAKDNLRKAADAGLFAYNLMQKIDSLCKEQLNSGELTVEARKRAANLIGSICMDLGKAIVVACADMDLPHVRRIILPSSILRFQMPITALTKYLEETQMTREEARWATVAIDTNNGGSTSSHRPFAQFFDLRSELFLRCLLSLELAHEGLQQEKGVSGIYAEIFTNHPGLEDSFEEALIKAKSQQAIEKLDSLSQSNMEADMSFLSGMRI